MNLFYWYGLEGVVLLMLLLLDCLRMQSQKSYSTFLRMTVNIWLEILSNSAEFFLSEIHSPFGCLFSSINFEQVLFSQHHFPLSFQ